MTFSKVNTRQTQNLPKANQLKLMEQVFTRQHLRLPEGKQGFRGKV